MSSGLPNWALSLNYWIISHRARIKYWSTVVLVSLDSILILIVLIFGVVYLVHLPERAGLFAETYNARIDWAAVQQRERPDDVLVVSTSAADAVAGTIDVVAELRNPNRLWYAPAVTYHWIIDGEAMGPEETFLLPTQRSVVTRFAVPSVAEVASADIGLVVDHVDWQRLTLPEQYSLPTFAFSDVHFQPYLGSGASGSRAVGSITNDSAQGFTSVRVSVLLYREGQLIGVGSQTVSQFLVGEQRPMDVRWFFPIQGVTSVETFAAVDNLDPLSTL